MSWNAPKSNAKALNSAKLEGALPEYRRVSQRQSNELGTFKAIDDAGKLWLIEFMEPVIRKGVYYEQRRKTRVTSW